MVKKRKPPVPADARGNNPEGWRGLTKADGTPMKKPGRKVGYKHVPNLSNVDPETGEIIDPNKPWGTKPPSYREVKNHSKVRNATPENSPMAKRKGGVCGAKRRGRMGPKGICCMQAGWGTDHLGYGHCRYHGGCTPSGNIYAAKEMIKEMEAEHNARLVALGMPIDVGPHEALIAEVQRTAGHVQWLQQLIQEMGVEAEANKEQADEDYENNRGGIRDVLTQFTNLGMRPSVWMDLYHQERKHLVDVSKACIAGGVAERQVRIAEDQGKLFAMVLLGVMRDPDLELTPAQQLVAKKVMRKHLMELPTVSQMQEATTPMEIIDAEEVEDEDEEVFT